MEQAAVVADLETQHVREVDAFQQDAVCIFLRAFSTVRLGLTKPVVDVASKTRCWALEGED